MVSRKNLKVDRGNEGRREGLGGGGSFMHQESEDRGTAELSPKVTSARRQWSTWCALVQFSALWLFFFLLLKTLAQMPIKF